MVKGWTHINVFIAGANKMGRVMSQARTTLVWKHNKLCSVFQWWPVIFWHVSCHCRNNRGIENNKMEMIWNRSSIVYFQLNESHIPASCRICRLPAWPLYLRQEALSTKYQTIFSTQCVILGRTFSSKSAKNSHSCLGRSFVRVTTRKRPPPHESTLQPLRQCWLT